MANFDDLPLDCVLQILGHAVDEQTICVIPHVCHQWREISESIVTREVIQNAAWHNNIPALRMGLARLKEWDVPQGAFSAEMDDFCRGLEERNMEIVPSNWGWADLSSSQKEEMALNSKAAGLCLDWALKGRGSN